MYTYEKIQWTGGLPVFSFPCKELGSCHSIVTTNRKLNRLKNQHPSWTHNRAEDTGQTTALNIGETDENGVTAYQSRDP